MQSSPFWVKAFLTTFCCMGGEPFLLKESGEYKLQDKKGKQGRESGILWSSDEDIHQGEIPCFLSMQQHLCRFLRKTD